MSIIKPDNIITEQPSLDQLPESFAIWVDSLSTIRLTGKESHSYLQGQVTCDVNQIAEKGLLTGSHCDAKGKVFSVFRLFEQAQSLHLLQHQDSIEQSLVELKKFGVFAKVEIEKSALSFLCLVGQKSENWLKQKFSQLPDELNPVITENESTLIYLAGQRTRYLLINEASQLASLALETKLPIYNHNVWTLLEITEGFPQLNQQSVQKFVPQMLNVDAINGISFNKGCYLGQETVARMQYLGKNKKVMTAFDGKASQSTELSLEKQVSENWRSGGDVIASYIADNEQCYLQAVVAKDDEPNQYRLKVNELPLTQINLPYLIKKSEQE